MRADTPMPSPRGMYTMSRDGSATKVVRRAPLVPIGSLTTCTRMSSPSLTRLRMSSTCPSAFGAWPTSVLLGIRRRNVGGVQEGGAFQAHVDERRLHARQHALHAALVEIADDAAAALALDEQLGQHAVFDERRARLARRHVDEDFRRHPVPPSDPAVCHSTPGCRAWRSSCCGFEQRQPHDAGVAAGDIPSTNTAPSPWMAYAPALPCGSPLAQ